MARILFFTRDYTPHDHRFLAALAESEHQVYYLRFERRGSQAEDRPVPYGVETIAWAGGNKPARFGDYPRLLAGLGWVIRRVKPDLIHAGPLHSCAFLAALAGFEPLVSMSWGYDLLLDADRNLLSGWATRFTLRRSRVVIGDCRAVREKAVQLGAAGEKIVTFPWGVDLKQFVPKDNDSRIHPDFVLLSTRNWEPIYGVDVLARAFVKAARENPGLRLILLGSGSQAALLRGIFIQGGVTEKVDFRGVVKQVDLPVFYQMADLYLSASHIDGSSVSLMEAMACGIPSVVSDIPGNREWVEPGVHGWWFPDGDDNELARAILLAADKRQGLPNMGRAARMRAESKANWTMNFQTLLGAYELALGRGATGER